jgi:hypothetical protein
MELSQTYESTVIDPDSGLALHFWVIPKRSLDGDVTSPDLIQTMKRLEVKPHCTISNARITHALTALLEIQNEHDSRIDNLNQLVSNNPEVFEFARFVATKVEVPFERSPLDGETLSAIVQSSGVAIGAALGFIAAANSPLLLFVLVPAGMIVCSAAEGVAIGIRDRLKKLVRGGKAVGKKRKR